MQRKKKKTPKILRVSQKSQVTTYSIDGKVILRQIRELEKERQMKI